MTSLIGQNYANIEIILVDDGSPDNSGVIIDQLPSKDKRIKVIHKENGGVSSARNSGINIATGDYLMFVDGDDWIDPDYMSYFVNLVMCNGCLVGMNTSNCYAGSMDTADKTYTVSVEKAIEWIYMGKVFVAVWNKIYSAKLLKETDICYKDEIWYGEGMLFNVEVLQFCDKVAVGEKSIYHQTANPNSAMRSFNLESNYCGIRSLELQKKKRKKVNERIENVWNYHRYSFNRSIIDDLVRSNTVVANKTVFEDCNHNVREDIRIPMTTDISIKQKLSWIAYATVPMFMAKRSARKFITTIEKFGEGGHNGQIAAYLCGLLLSIEWHELNHSQPDIYYRWKKNILCNTSNSIMGGVA